MTQRQLIYIDPVPCLSISSHLTAAAAAAYLPAYTCLLDAGQGGANTIDNRAITPDSLFIILYLTIDFYATA